MAQAHPVWKARTAKAPDPLVLALCAGRDVAVAPPADLALLPHDIRQNRAQALMLRRQGIIDRATARKLLRALAQLERRAERGEFVINPACEDVHMAVEQAVARIAGADAAGRLHAGRSRNDQSATDLRLWLRERVAAAESQLIALADTLARRARRDADVVMPGHTHMQPAMVTTLGHLWASHAHALLRDVAALQALHAPLDRCPLGAAAAFGTDWPIDRAWVARLLGFAAPEPNSLDAITNRWEIEARAAQAWAIALTHLATLAADVIWLSTPPRTWLRLDDAHVTGSSIMPQKRNPDPAEVTRARAVACQAAAQAIVATAHGLISGYNRDLQWTKYHVMEAWWQFDQTPEVWRRIVSGIACDRRAMRLACGEGFMESAEVADHIARRMDLPFRKLHGVLARAAQACETEGRLTLGAVNGALVEAGLRYQLSPEEWALLSDPAARLRQRRHDGSPGPTWVKRDVDAVRRTLAAARASLSTWQRGQAAAARRLRTLAAQAIGR